MIDKTRLLAWLKDRSHARSFLVGAIYQGLVDSIQRGDFDAKEGD